MTIHVTETQRFILRTALEVSGADERLRDTDSINDIIRAMLVIEEGRMQPYMLRGFNWSCRSRGRREPQVVSRDIEQLERSVEWFHQHIDAAGGEPARRIRGNRARRFKQLLQEAQEMQEAADRQVRDLLLGRRDVFHRNPANWDEEPRRLPGAGAF